MRFKLYRLHPAAANGGFADEVAVLNARGRSFKLSGAPVKNFCRPFYTGHIS